MAQTPLDLKDMVYMKTRQGDEIEFSVVALLEDEEGQNTYAVLRSESEDGEESFIVTDPYGTLVEDDELAQQVLDDYLLFNEKAGEEGEA